MENPKHISTLLLLSGLLFSCGGNSPATTSSVGTTSSGTNTASTTAEETSSAPAKQDVPVTEPVTLGEDPLITEKASVEGMFKDEYANATNGIEKDKIVAANYFKNGKYLAEAPSSNEDSDDVKLEFHTADSTRFIDVAAGYAVTLPKNKGFKVDYEFARNGMKFTNDTERVRLSYETVRPYPHTAQYYNTYMREWVTPFISKEAYIEENDMEYFLPSIDDSKNVISGYSVTTFHIKINGLKSLSHSYYNFAFIKKKTTFEGFFFIHLKSATDDQTTFEQILKSYQRLTPTGTAKNYMPEQHSIVNPDWNDRTKAYYENMKKKDVPDWGYFFESFPNTVTDNHASIKKVLQDELAWLESDEYTGHKSELIATYSHISWYDLDHFFSPEFAKGMAGGDGTNGKMVMQYTYQYTTNSNAVRPDRESDVASPIFNIFRGKYDEKFHKLARDLKAYEAPILFRLNNEMNSDWTSYCGLFNLLDPELFTLSWQYLYNIFKEEHVDNCIWVWNPFDDTFPVSCWGDYFAYWPGEEYVQVLGLTSYEYNNYNVGEGDSRKDFDKRYGDLYEYNKDYFLELPWFVGEFACGAGGVPGEVGRNQDYQAEFIRKMFESIKAKKPFVTQIKGYIWFSKDDMGNDGPVNYIKLEKKLTDTLGALRVGLKSIHE